MNTRLVLASTFCAAALALGGCASNPTNTQIGTGVGAVVGGVAGNAVLGGTLGTVGGAAAGATMLAIAAIALVAMLMPNIRKGKDTALQEGG